MNSQDFPILGQQIHGHRLAYLDNAATTQKPQQVIDSISFAYSHFNANIHRATHTLATIATEHHEHARQTVAGFINAHNAKEIVFTKGTTDAINTAAFTIGETLSEGDEVIVSAMEHHSNLVPWQMLCQRKKLKLRVAPLKDDLTLDTEKLKQLFNSRTKVLSIAHVSNVLGIANPIEKIVKEAHKNNIIVLIDAAQSIPHLPIDVQKIDCDFLAFSAHKIYGPTGIGVLYGKQEILEQLPPYQGGGEMINHVSFENTTYNTLPYKFEAGTPDFIGSYAFGKALEYVENIGMENIAEHERNLCRLAERQLKEKFNNIKIYAEGIEKSGVISFNILRNDGSLIHPYDIAMLLDQQGVAVRSGHHCAEPLINILGVVGTVRVSFGLYNEENDINQLIAALSKSVDILS